MAPVAVFGNSFYYIKFSSLLQAFRGDELEDGAERRDATKNWEEHCSVVDFWKEDFGGKSECIGASD